MAAYKISSSVPFSFSQEILDELRKHAEMRAEYRRYRSGKSQWQRGLLGDEIKPIYVGIVGEQAVADFLNGQLGGNAIQPNFKLCNDGDGGVDLSIVGMSAQVKTTQRDRRYQDMLIRCRDEFGKPVELPEICAYISAFWDDSEKHGCIDGWIHGIDLRQLPEVPARRGDHLNHEVPAKLLKPMTSLVRLIQAREKLRECLRFS